jgi:hypothetical protein
MILSLPSDCYVNRGFLTGTIPSVNPLPSFGDMCIVAKAPSFIAGASLWFYVSAKKVAVESGSIITIFLGTHPSLPPSIYMNGDSSNQFRRRAKGVPGYIIHFNELVLFTFVLSKAWSRFTFRRIFPTYIKRDFQMTRVDWKANKRGMNKQSTVQTKFK